VDEEDSVSDVEEVEWHVLDNHQNSWNVLDNCQTCKLVLTNAVSPPIKNQETVFGLVTVIEKAKSISIAEHHAHAVSSQAVSTIIDSGATVHIHGTLKSLHGIKPCNVKVGVANGKVVTATSKGTWFLKSVFDEQKCHAVLEDTLHIPGVTHNLVSVSKLVKHGHHFYGSTDFKILLGKKLVIGGLICDVGLYKVDVISTSTTPSIQKAFPATTCTTGIPLIDLWHLRLNHVSAPYLKKS
jgi:hypothetical protein